MVLDFEATCSKEVRLQPQEVIEFPFVVVDAQTLQVRAGSPRGVRSTSTATLRKTRSYVSRIPVFGSGGVFIPHRS